MSDESPHANEEIKDNSGLGKTVKEIEAEKMEALAGVVEKAKKDKEKRFYEDPDSFVETKDLIIATMDSSEGIMTYIGKGVKRHKLEISQSRLNHLISQEFMRMEVEAFKKTQAGKRIFAPNQKPKGAFGNPFKRR